MAQAALGPHRTDHHSGVHESLHDKESKDQQNHIEIKHEHAERNIEIYENVQFVQPALGPHRTDHDSGPPPERHKRRGRSDGARIV